MLLKKLLFWSNNDHLQTSESETNKKILSDGNNQTNVVEFRKSIENETLNIDDSYKSKNTNLITNSTEAQKGIMSDDALTKFLNNNYFGLGQHNGLNFQSYEAEELEIESIISKFQNTIESLIENKKTRLGKIRQILIKTDGASKVISNQLELAITQLSNEINDLRIQLDLSNSRKGWVLNALNQYRIGYAKGLREAIDAKILFE